MYAMAMITVIACDFVDVIEPRGLVVEYVSGGFLWRLPYYISLRSHDNWTDIALAHICAFEQIFLARIGLDHSETCIRFWSGPGDHGLWLPVLSGPAQDDPGASR